MIQNPIHHQTQVLILERLDPIHPADRDVGTKSFGFPHKPDPPPEVSRPVFPSSRFSLVILSAAGRHSHGKEGKMKRFPKEDF
jgi:hypothetical protein